MSLAAREIIRDKDYTRRLQIFRTIVKNLIRREIWIFHEIYDIFYGSVSSRLLFIIMNIKKKVLYK